MLLYFHLTQTADGAFLWPIADPRRHQGLAGAQELGLREVPSALPVRSCPLDRCLPDLMWRFFSRRRVKRCSHVSEMIPFACGMQQPSRYAILCACMCLLVKDCREACCCEHRESQPPSSIVLLPRWRHHLCGGGPNPVTPYSFSFPFFVILNMSSTWGPVTNATGVCSCGMFLQAPSPGCSICPRRPAGPSRSAHVPLSMASR